MYVAIRRYEGIDQASAEELFRRVNDGFAPLVSGLPGFVSYYALDAGDGVLASISVFESREQAEESTSAAADWVRQNLADLVQNPPQVTAGEVKAQA
jgi:heme-degrading monooxygenase HmoA